MIKQAMRGRIPLPRILIGVGIALALVSAGCGGSTAPGGYTCNVPNSYCATYANLSASDYGSSSSIAGAYSEIGAATLTCAGACATTPYGYIANLIMMIDGGGQNWVEAGLWNDGYYGGGTQFFEGVGVNGLPHYQAPGIAPATNHVYNIGAEIRQFSVGGNIGWAVRMVGWLYDPVSHTESPGYIYTLNNIVPTGSLAGPNVTLTHVEFGQFLRGTAGSAAQDTFFSPVIMTTNVLSTNSMPALSSGYPNTEYPNQLVTGEPLQFANHSATQPPFGAWIDSLSDHTAPPTSPQYTPLLIQCCVAS